MAVDPTQINQSITSAIYANGRGAITGATLATVLLGMVAWVNTNFTDKTSRGVFDPRDYGAYCDGGVHDDYAGFAAAQGKAQTAGGGDVLVPATGKGCFLTHGLSAENGVRLIGVGGSVLASTESPLADRVQAGSWLVSSDLANPTVTLHGHGSAVRDVNFTRNQVIPSSTPGTPYTPTSFPFEIIDTSGNASSIENVRMIAVSNGISLSYDNTHGGGTFTHLSHIDIDAMSIAFQTINVNDTITGEDFHFRSFFYAGNSNVVTYREANTIGWDRQYTDNFQLDAMECFQLLNCIKDTNSTLTINGVPVSHAGYNVQIAKVDCNLVVICFNVSASAIVTGRVTEVVAQGDTANNVSTTLFQIPSDTVDLTIGDVQIPTTGGIAFALGSGVAGGRLNITRLRMGQTVNGISVPGYAAVATGQPAITVAANFRLAIGSREVTRATTAGAFLTGAGAGNVNMPTFCWSPFGAPDQVTITATGSPAVFTSLNEDATGYHGDFLQMRLLAAPNVTTSAVGNLVLQMQNFQNRLDGVTPITLSFATNTTGLKTLGDTNWLDVPATSTIIGAMTQNAPVGSVFKFGTLTACFR